MVGIDRIWHHRFDKSFLFAVIFGKPSLSALLDRHVGAAVDVIVVDAAKLAQHRDTPGLIYQHALMKSRVCYDRTDVVKDKGATDVRS